MKTVKCFILTCCFAIALVGCAHTSGTKVEQSSLSQIQKGVTTKENLVAKFGAPNSSSYSADGKETVSWNYVGSKIKGTTFIPVVGMFNNGVKTSMSSLRVTLSKDKVVEDYTLTEGAHDFKSGL